jgi:hypothetical protein
MSFDRRSIALCGIALGEELYIDEWIQYHLKLGFHHIVVYDNSDTFELKRLIVDYPADVTVIHFPGRDKKLMAYNHMVTSYGRRYYYCAFLDIDEFLVLPRHQNISSFLNERLRDNGFAMIIFTYLFGSNGHLKYSDAPVVERFVKRHSLLTDDFKWIVVCNTLDTRKPFSDTNTPVFLEEIANLPGLIRDASGRQITNSRAYAPSDEYGYINHYYCKSVEEFMKKKERGHPNKRYFELDFCRNDKNEIVDTKARDFFNL